MRLEQVESFVSLVDNHIRSGIEKIQEEEKQFETRRAIILDKRKALRNEIYELINGGN